MKVLVMGSGGREHALGWKLSQSPELTALFFVPGNPGTAQYGVNLNLKNYEDIVSFCCQESVDLVVVGPEQPLVDGIADMLLAAGITCFGPKAAAARLEGSKSFAKQIMEEAGVPTAAYRAFTDFETALGYAETQPHPLVVKADGLASGKGVSICTNLEETKKALEDALQNGKFGAAGGLVVIEAFLVGTECSFHVIADGQSLLPLISAQDHKTLYEANQGPNTGGMGTFAPCPGISNEQAQRITEEICAPVLKAMANHGLEFRGVLFAGLMLTAKGVFVLEFNCRFGDPETQVIMSLMDFDLLPVLNAAAKGLLSSFKPHWKEGAATCVVMAAAGYPDAPRKGDVISGLDRDATDAVVFHAGTGFVDSQLVVNGGRVLGVTACGSNLAEARERAYHRVAQIHFNGAQYRRDIGLIRSS